MTDRYHDSHAPHPPSFNALPERERIRALKLGELHDQTHPTPPSHADLMAVVSRLTSAAADKIPSAHVVASAFLACPKCQRISGWIELEKNSTEHEYIPATLVRTCRDCAHSWNLKP